MNWSGRNCSIIDKKVGWPAINLSVHSKVRFPLCFKMYSCPRKHIHFLYSYLHLNRIEKKEGVMCYYWGYYTYYFVKEPWRVRCCNKCHCSLYSCLLVCFAREWSKKDGYWAIICLLHNVIYNLGLFIILI